MSKLTEMADEEVARLEAEEPDDDDDEESDEPDEELDEEEEQEARGPSDADLKRFESENRRHETALAKIVGADWSSFAACGVCGGVGFVPDELNVDSPLERDPNTETCTVCNGYGATRSGARAPGQTEIPCNACSGSGWRRKPERPDVQPIVDGAAPAPQTSAAPPANGGYVDPRVAELRALGYLVVETGSPAPVPAS